MRASECGLATEREQRQAHRRLALRALQIELAAAQRSIALAERGRVCSRRSEPHAQIADEAEEREARQQAHESPQAAKRRARSRVERRAVVTRRERKCGFVVEPQK